MSRRIPVVRADGQGDRQQFSGGGVHTWKATADETGGAFLLFEDLVGEGKTTPLHRHPDADELQYVLAGEIIVHIDGDEHRLGPGGIALVPRGVPHAFLVVSDGARMLTLQTPGSAQDFYRGASEPLATDAPPSDAIDIARVQASAKQHGGVEMLGPPPFHQS